MSNGCGISLEPVGENPPLPLLVSCCSPALLVFAAPPFQSLPLCAWPSSLCVSVSPHGFLFPVCISLRIRTPVSVNWERSPSVRGSEHFFFKHSFFFFCFCSSSAGKESACNVGDPSSIPGSGKSPLEGYLLQDSWTSLLAQMGKNLPARWETWVQYLGWEDSLEKGTATHCSILAWRFPWIEAPGGLQSMGLQSPTRLSYFHFHLG